jgi:hypothetical protein
MALTRWRFIHKTNSSQVILVDDYDSARVLWNLLKTTFGDQWAAFKETSADPLADPAPAQAPVPVKAAAPAAPLPQRPSNLNTPSAPPLVQAQAPSFTQPKAAPSVESVLQGVAPMSIVESNEDAASGAERRKHPRFNHRFRVILVCKARSFRTFSSDVSLGGMLLKDEVPESMLDMPCSVFIGSQDSGDCLEMKCKILTRGTNHRAITFGIAEPAVVKQLADWIKLETSKTMDSKKAA